MCGICSPSKNVVYASGTQYPDREAGILKTTDGGQTWTSISMAAHANLLIDNYFVDDLHGWVVGGEGGTDYPDLKPVVLFTADGGETWENRLQNSGIDFPRGEWGWKIQFLTPQIGFVSLENDTAAAILKTTDGGQNWKRIEVKDPQKNVDLEGIGFIDEKVGWVGGWGHGFMADTPTAPPAAPPTAARPGSTPTRSAASSTASVSSRRNRIVGYASGGTIYQCTASEAPPAARSPPRLARRRAKCRFPMAWDKHGDQGRRCRTTRKKLDDHHLQSPANAGEGLDRGEIAAARAPQLQLGFQEGRRQGRRHRPLHLPHRRRRHGQHRHGGAAGARRTGGSGDQVVQMITRIAPIALRSHDDLMLPDATGTPVTLKSLFHAPRELMAALVRGGWVIPGEPDRSMFLVAIIGTGPMKGRLSPADVELLTDWVNAGAVIPAAGVACRGIFTSPRSARGEVGSRCNASG